MARKGVTFKKHKKQRGGFYPSVMGTILKSGPIFLSLAGFQARKLLANDKSRISSRKRSRNGTRKTKRS